MLKKAIRAMSKDFQATIEAVYLLFSLSGDEDSQHERCHNTRCVSHPTRDSSCGDTVALESNGSDRADVSNLML